MISIAKKSSDSVLHSLIHSLLTLSNEATNNQLSNMSEMHVQASYVQPLLRGITKTMPTLVPHCSNKLAFENEHCIMHCRPDYRVDLYTGTGMYDGTNLFGELKPATATADDVTCDFQKCMGLGKLALKVFKYDYVMTFYSVGTSIHFYLHHSFNSHLSYSLHLHSFEIHTTFDTFPNYASLIPVMYRLSQIYRLLCTPHSTTHTPSSSTVPYPIVKKLIQTNKKRKTTHDS
ncbi:hypothetical protein BD560DRAFT_403742 [Blakeslea trispora]|nr:hypothetical protein BD560DRAFT_403742 [Blakeslea trispora]